MTFSIAKDMFDHCNHFRSCALIASVLHVDYNGHNLSFYSKRAIVKEDYNRLMSEPLAKRRDLPRKHILPKPKDPIRESPELNSALLDVINAVRARGHLTVSTIRRQCSG